MRLHGWLHCRPWVYLEPSETALLLGLALAALLYLPLKLGRLIWGEE